MTTDVVVTTGLVVGSGGSGGSTGSAGSWNTSGSSPSFSCFQPLYLCTWSSATLTTVPVFVFCNRAMPVPP